MLEFLEGRGPGWPARWALSWGPLMVLAPALPWITAGLGAASAGMTIIGAGQQAQGQRMLGQQAIQQAQIRRAAGMEEARRLEAGAIADEATGQRVAIGEERKGELLAARARAVMASSGAGVDNKLIAGLIGQGDYGGRVAMFNAGEKARSLRDRAALVRWGAETGVAVAGGEADAYNSRADSTFATGLAGGVMQGIGAGVTLASKYGEPTKKTKTDDASGDLLTGVRLA